MNRHSSRPDHWTMPRPHQDASLRYRMHGKLQPMHDYGINVRREVIGGAVVLLLVGMMLAGVWIAAA